MLGVTFRLRAGHPQDAPRVLALLSAAGLPISDLVPADLLRFIVAQDAAVHTGGIVIGAVGLEAHGEAGLLRSLVVDPGWQGTGVGSALVVDGGVYRHDFVASSVVQALMDVQLRTGVPVISAVQAPHHFHEHVEHRRFLQQHFAAKGQEAAQACLLTVAGLRAVDQRLAGL